jgi:hypothetical protein
LVLLLAHSASAAPRPAKPTDRAPAYLGPGGILPSGTHAFFLLADTELSGYPAGFLGWRMGLGDLADVGLEGGGNDAALVARVHAKLRLWEPPGRRWFTGLRLRVEMKRHQQTFDSGTFRPIDDLGLTFVPELSFALRLGAQRQHALSYAAFYYLDVDVRPGRGVEHYLLPAMLGWEMRFARRFHLELDAGVFFELMQPKTAGEPLFKLQLLVGMEL